jgi:4-oxalocrotonate tautomerase
MARTVAQPGRLNKENRPMPTIRIELFEGRSAELKAALAREVTEACVRVLGGNASGVDVLFFDIKRGDWATGGVMWSQAGAPVP